jgi:hypothetical protein
VLEAGAAVMAQTLADVLDHAGLGHCWYWERQELLNYWGVYSPGDLSYWQEGGLSVYFGMTCEQARRVKVILSMLCSGALPEIARAASEAEQNATNVLRDASTIRQEVVSKCINHALQCLEEATKLPNSAMLALNCVNNAFASSGRREGSADVRQALDAAAKAVREVLVWRVQLRATWGLRPAFINELEMANGGESVDDPTLSKIMQAHKIVVSNRFPSALLSTSRAKLVQSGKVPRPPKWKLGHQGECNRASQSSAHRGASDADLSRELHRLSGGSVQPDAAQAASSDESNKVVSVSIGQGEGIEPPPGLGLACSSCDADAGDESCDAASLRQCLEISQAKATSLEIDEMRAIGVIGCPHIPKAKGIAHPSGARTECLSDVAAEVDEDDGDEGQRDRCDDTILLLFDLNHMLGWRDYESKYFNASPWGTQCNFPFLEHRFYPRPDVDGLLATLLRHSGCQFHIASGLGRMYCVPYARMLLNHAIPGDWVADEIIEGRWTRDDTDILIIEKVSETETLKLEETMYKNQTVEHRTFDLSLASDDSVKYEKAGVIHRGMLTPDGVLEWSLNNGETEQWRRAGCSRPISLIRKDRQMGIGEQERVFVFYRGDFMEELSSGDDVAAAAAAAVVKQKEEKKPKGGGVGGGPILEERREGQQAPSIDAAIAAEQSPATAVAAADSYYLKDLYKIWTALRECKCGSWDEENTIFFDHSADHSSHEKNVVRVPPFKSMQDTELQKLSEYIKMLLDKRPSSAPVKDFLEEHPYGTFK